MCVCVCDILHPKPYTLRLTPYTPHPTLCTLHPTPYALHTRPYTKSLHAERDCVSGQIHHRDMFEMTQLEGLHDAYCNWRDIMAT